jgi:penicillin-binding protein 1A
MTKKKDLSPKAKKNIIFAFWTLFSLLIFAILAAVMWIWLGADIPSFEELERPESNLATQVIADDGKTVLSTFHIENRSYVTYDDLSPNLIKALVATEDARFYKHSGIDFESLARVIVKTLLGGDSSQGGGSTVTQQLAKTLYPRQDLSELGMIKKACKMIGIKLTEWGTAVKLERSYTKEEIITMYFNQVFFGSNAYGIKAAAQTFFAKNPIDLTVEESATLVGMVNKPTRYNPALNPDKSLARRNFVISQMCKAGYLSEAEADSIKQIPITLSYQIQDHTAGSALYFRDMLKRTMSASEPMRSSYREYEDYVVDSLQWAEDPLYGWLNKNLKPDGTKYDIYRDGLRIYTTVNYKMQRYAEEAVAEHLGGDLQGRFDRGLSSLRNQPFSNDVDKGMINSVMKLARRDSDRFRNLKKAGMSEDDIYKTFSQPQEMKVFAWKGKKKTYVDTVMTPDDSIRYYKRHLRSSFIAMTPDRGEIKAYVGGPDFKAFQYDNARQSKRQVGSTIKPFLYTLAMQEGMSPCDEVANVPQTFIIAEDKVWTPKSTDKDEYIGNIVTLKWGLAKSSNNISAYLMKQYGPEAMVEMMRKMGVGSFLDPVPPLCVGSANISLFEMVAAYNTFPSKGVYIRPLFVTRIEDNEGNVLAEFSTKKREAISEQTAYLMANLMQGVVNTGTGYALRSRFALTGEMAGKTGTTNNNADGWFIGYTPELTAGVWTGFENEQIHFQYIGNGGGSASALPIWGLFMQKVTKDPSLVRYYDKTAFDRPVGYDIDLRCTGAETSSSVTQNTDDTAETPYFDDYDEEAEQYFE